MAPEEIERLQRVQPFQPFRLVMTDGKTYDINHPELLLVGKRSAVLGLVDSSDDTLADRFVSLDPLHIVRLEPIGKSTGKNGKKKH